MKNLSEVLVAIAMLVVMFCKIDPWHWFMPNETQMVLLCLLVAGVSIWVGLIFREKARDERESLHLYRASRAGYLVGVAALSVLVVIGGGGVDDVQHHVGQQGLLEGRREPFDKLCRQASDEPDGVGDEVAPAVVLEASRRRIERLEEAVLDRDLGAGERIQQRRLADVRVAGESNGRRCIAPPFLPLGCALLLHILQPLAQK